MKNHSPVIEISRLCHTFEDGTRILKDISLNIRKGEWILLAGKNGSGKSTLLRHLNGLLSPKSGMIKVNGRDISKDLLYARKTIGMVFQDPDTQMIGDTVFDEVAFGPENLKLSRSRINETVNRILEMMQLKDLKGRHPSTLSGGEKRKVAIAGVLAMDPEVIVLDEPFSNLDYPGMLQIIAAVRDLKAAGHTLIIATHDVEPIIAEVTRTIIMEKGALREDGPPAALLSCLEFYGVREPCLSKLGIPLKPWPA